MAFSTDAVSNWFISAAEAAGRNLTPMKLQKLLYYANGWHLALESSGLPLVNEEPEAWEWGPVFPSAYREFRKFGARPITGFASATRVRDDGETEIWNPTIEEESERDTEMDLVFAHAVLNRVWEIYGRHTAAELSRKTHERGTPWWMIRERAKMKFNGRMPMGLNIPNEMTRQWFAKQSKISAK